MQENENVADLVCNVKKEYSNIKEEHLPNINPGILLDDINLATVYTTKIDDMPLVTKPNEYEDLSYSAFLKEIERLSKPRYELRSHLTRKRKSSMQSYDALEKRLKLMINRERLVASCKPGIVVLEKLPVTFLETTRFVIKEECQEEDDIQIKTEENVENISPLNTQLSDIIENVIDSSLKISSYRIPRSAQAIKSCIYVEDKYFYQTVICGVDDKGKIRTYFRYSGIKPIDDEMLAICDNTTCHTFVRCCWFSLIDVVRELWYRILKIPNDNNIKHNSYDFLCRPHTCRPNTCECCCKNEFSHQPNRSLVISNYMKELTVLNTEQFLEDRILMSSKIHRGLYNPQISIEVRQNSLEVVNAYTKLIILKNIETCQSELYYFNKYGIICGYYILWYKTQMPVVKQILNDAAIKTHHQFNLIVCCWAKREKEITAVVTKNLRHISPSIARYMKCYHACDPHNCKCCCKNKISEDKKPNKAKIILKPLDLPNVRKHTVNCRPIHRVVSQTEPNSNKGKVTKENEIQNKEVTVQNERIHRNENKLIVSEMKHNVTNYGKQQTLNSSVLTQTTTFYKITQLPNTKSTKKSQYNKKSRNVAKNSKQDTSDPSISTKTTTRSKIKRFITPVQATKSATPPPPHTVVNYTGLRVTSLSPKEVVPDQPSTANVNSAKSLSGVIITVDDKKKAAAALPFPATSYPTEELHVLAKLLKIAQDKINRCSLPPGTTLDINVIARHANLDPIIPPIIPPTPVPAANNTSKIQFQQTLYKVLTEAATKKILIFKKCFYRGKNIGMLKITESENNHALEMKQENEFEEIEGELQQPSTSQSSNVIKPDPDNTEPSPQFDKVLYDSNSDDEYEMDYSEDILDNKDIIFEDITIDETGLGYQFNNSDESDECILGT